MQLNELKPNPGSKHRRKRLGCGESSGHGKTSGRGHKGQKARAGGSIRPGFEGGQMPLYRRLPKRGFSNAQFKRKVATVNLDDLDLFADGEQVNEASLKAKGLIRGDYEAVKLLARGELSKKLSIEVDEASESAKAKVESAGGSLILRSNTAPAEAAA
ncbi:MAG: 50S ribosomal protein L15 [Verrucomicrobiales bacterium]